MAFTSGVVTAANGASGFLQSALIPWVTGAGGTPGRDWTIEVNQNAKKSDGSSDSQHGATCKEYCLSNSGKSAGEYIYVGMREYRYASETRYGLELNGYLGDPSWFGANLYPSILDLDSYDVTRDFWSELPVLQLLDSTMTYWIYSNQDRIVAVVKVASDYYGMYIGFGQRLASVGEYPYPMMVCGSAVGNLAYTSGGSGITRPIAADPARMFCISPGNTYIKGTDIRQIPMQYSPDETPYGPAPDGRYIMLPSYILDNANARTLLDRKSVV